MKTVNYKDLAIVIDAAYAADNANKWDALLKARALNEYIVAQRFPYISFEGTLVVEEGTEMIQGLDLAGVEIRVTPGCSRLQLRDCKLEGAILPEGWLWWHEDSFLRRVTGIADPATFGDLAGHVLRASPAKKFANN